MKNAFILKDSNYPISMGRTKEDRNVFKALLKEKKDLNKKICRGNACT